ncbi:MAG: hypothetical protein WBA51_11360 [Erythrobacter sp.]
MPAPASAIWIATLAHCAGSRASSQSGNMPGMAAAVAITAASPATTKTAIHQPLSKALRANNAPRAAKLRLAMTKATAIDSGFGTEPMPSAPASRTRANPASKASSTPIHRRPPAAAPIIPTPIRPTASIGPPTTAKGTGADAFASSTMAATGARIPANAVVSQARAEPWTRGRAKDSS